MRRGALCLVVLACVVTAYGQGRGVRHVRIAGDIDCERFAREIRETLIEVDGKRPALIVVELGGDGARLDLVRDIAAQMRELESPVAVWLADDDRRVGVGQLLLALHAGRVFVDPGTRVVTGADPGSLAPEDTDWEQVRREVAGAIWLRLQGEHTGLSPLARGLSFGEPTRIMLGVDGAIASLDPHAWDVDALVLVGDGGAVDVAGGVLVALGLAAPAEGARTIARDAAGVGGVGRALVLRSGLRRAHEASVRAVVRLGELLEAGDEALRIEARGRSLRSAEVLARRRGRPLIRAAADVMRGLEDRLLDYPEITALPLTGDSGASGAERREEWSRALVEIRERYGALRDRYEGLGGGLGGG